VKINTQLYQQLKTQIGKGKISEFVEKTLTEKLEQKEQELELAYKEIAQDKKR
ncbi:14504_t:CDS:1, partial [Funneliformis geosporum]